MFWSPFSAEAHSSRKIPSLPTNHIPTDSEAAMRFQVVVVLNAMASTLS